VDERDGGPQDANHVVSKRIVEQHPHSLIGLEHLTDIRERTKRKKGKKASKKQRKANAASSKWSFAELQGMIAYKALLADLVGARNLTMRTLLVRQDWARTGTLEVGPDVSDKEAKAERLRRYAELRWSLDTSPRLKPWGD
jgi:IS605 OrfB family transposase